MEEPQNRSLYLCVELTPSLAHIGLWVEDESSIKPLRFIGGLVDQSSILSDTITFFNFYKWVKMEITVMILDPRSGSMSCNAFSWDSFSSVFPMSLWSSCLLQTKAFLKHAVLKVFLVATLKLGVNTTHANLITPQPSAMRFSFPRTYKGQDTIPCLGHKEPSEHQLSPKAISKLGFLENSTQFGDNVLS
jgi:hypothetical protein